MYSGTSFPTASDLPGVKRRDDPTNLFRHDRNVESAE
jgi:hypothetical protein